MTFRGRLASRIAALFLGSALGGLGAYSAAAQTAAPAPFVTVSSQQFAATSDGSLFIDVREPTEWEQSGMPASAQGVSLKNEDFVERVLALAGGDKSKPVAVICRSGARSQRAAQQLTDAGFSNVTNVGDGMIGREGVGEGWLKSELPLRQPD